MKYRRIEISFLLIILIVVVSSCSQDPAQKRAKYMKRGDGYFEKQGLNVLVFNNWYNDNFSDSKISGIEIIHHGIRTATNGDVRLNPTPEQWDPIFLIEWDYSIVKYIS